MSVKVLLKICLDGSDILDFLDYPAVTVYQEYTSASAVNTVKFPDTLCPIQIIKLNPGITVGFYGLMQIVERIELPGHAYDCKTFILILLIDRYVVCTAGTMMPSSPARLSGLQSVPKANISHRPEPEH